MNDPSKSLVGVVLTAKPFNYVRISRQNTLLEGIRFIHCGKFAVFLSTVTFTVLLDIWGNMYVVYFVPFMNCNFREKLNFSLSSCDISKSFLETNLLTLPEEIETSG